MKFAQGVKFAFDRCENGTVLWDRGYAYDGGGHFVQRVEVSLTVKPNSTVFAVSQRPELAATRNFGVVCIECYFSSVDIPLTQCLNLGSSLGSAFTIQTCLKASTPLWNGKC